MPTLEVSNRLKVTIVIRLNNTIVVPTPHNTLVIMWGRDKNFQVLMMYELLNRENKILLIKVFYYSPFKNEIQPTYLGL